MIDPVQVDPKSLEHELNLPIEKIEATLALLKEGRPASFIARYRKDATKLGKRDDVMKIAELFHKQRRFADRKYSYLKMIEAQGKLTDELKTMILEARSPHRLDDLVAPFKSREAGAGQDARDKGLEPLADAIMNATDPNATLEALAAPFVSEDQGVASVQDAIDGAAAIIVDKFADAFKLRQAIRSAMNRDGVVVTKRAESVDAAPEATATATEAGEATETDADAPVEAPETKKQDKKSRRSERKKSAASARADQLDKLFKDFANATFSLRDLARSRSRLGALDRAESLKYLTVSIDGDRAKLKELARQTVSNAGNPFVGFLNERLDEAVETRVLPIVASDIRRDFAERVVEQNCANVAGTIRNLVMRRPVAGRRALAADTSRRGENVVVALDQFGNYLDSVSVHFSGSDERVADAAKKVAALVERYSLTVFAIRDGLSYKKAEEFFTRLIANELAGKDVGFVKISELGVEEYALSECAKAESPNLNDVRVRAALTVGRRLLNPLEEYVKVAPEKLVEDSSRRKSRSRSPRELVAKVIAQCVDQSVVDVNRASFQTLRYVAGLNPTIAKNVVDYRRANGFFKSREELKKVLGVSEAVFQNCAGFLKVFDGANPFDATWIHPESYELATALLAKLGFEPSDLRKPAKATALSDAVKAAKADELAAELNAGQRLVEDILTEFVDPCRDARQNEPTRIFKTKITPIAEIQAGARLVGEVVSVVDFGAFVDICASTPGLVHHSQLAQPRPDARGALAVGDVVAVWVLSTNVAENKISLTMIDPSIKRESVESPEPRRARGRRGAERKEGEQDERRPRREPREGGEKRERGERSERGENRERGERREGGRRGDRDRDRERAPRVAQVAPKAKETKPLSEEKKSGKELLQSFEELKQFFEQN